MLEALHELEAQIPWGLDAMQDRLSGDSWVFDSVTAEQVHCSCPATLVFVHAILDDNEVAVALDVDEGEFVSISQPLIRPV